MTCDTVSYVELIWILLGALGLCLVGIGLGIAMDKVADWYGYRKYLKLRSRND